MEAVSVDGGMLRIRPLGWARIFALSSGLDIPIADIRRAAAGPPGLPHFEWGDFRAGGTGVPGFCAMGTYMMGQPRQRVFLDLRASSKSVLSLEIDGHDYARVRVEVENLDAALKAIRDAGGPAEV